MKKEERKLYVFLFAGLLGAGFLLRLLLSGLAEGYTGDLNCFLSWSERVARTGFGSFYSEYVFTDYPPGYMYILYVIGWIYKSLSLDGLSAPTLILLKFPAVLCDTLTAFFLWRTARSWDSHRKAGEADSQGREKWALFIAAVYYFNPAVLINSAVWGQVDSVFTLCLLVTFYFLVKKKLPASYFAFALGILIKPQSLIFTPALLFAVWERLFKNGAFCLREFSRQAVFALLAVLSLFAGMWPFGLNTVIEQYIRTLSSYPYASVNAYNLWNLFGLNWVSQKETVFGVSYQQIGSLAIIGIVVLAAYVYYKKREEAAKYYFSAAALIGGMFLFSVRMHERYLYPILPILLFSWIFTKNRQLLYVYLSFSLGHFLNVWAVLVKKENRIGELTPFSFLASLLLLITFVCFIYGLLKRGNASLSGRDRRGKHSAEGV